MNSPKGWHHIPGQEFAVPVYDDTLQVSKSGRPLAEPKSPAPVDLAKPSVKLQNQQAEWLGDALLEFYVRAYLIHRNPSFKIGLHAHSLSRLKRNSLLREFALAHFLPGADAVEREIFKKWCESPDEAEKFVDSICDWYFKNYDH